MRRMTGSALIAALALVACTRADELPTGTQPVPMVKDSPAEMLADALVEADLAARTKDAAGLERALATIGALDARPMDPAAEAQLAHWQSQSPASLPPLRGRTLGPGFRKGTLTAGAAIRIEQTFLSGQKASVALSTPEGARLRLEVIDNTAQPICRDVAAAPVCEWIPIYSQRHLIQLTNVDRHDTRFYLVIE